MRFSCATGSGAGPHQPQQRQEIAEADLAVFIANSPEVIRDVAIAARDAAGAGADEPKEGEEVTERDHAIGAGSAEVIGDVAGAGGRGVGDGHRDACDPQFAVDGAKRSASNEGRSDGRRSVDIEADEVDLRLEVGRGCADRGDSRDQVAGRVRSVVGVDGVGLIGSVEETLHHKGQPESAQRCVEVEDHMAPGRGDVAEIAVVVARVDGRIPGQLENWRVVVVEETKERRRRPELVGTGGGDRAVAGRDDKRAEGGAGVVGRYVEEDRVRDVGEERGGVLPGGTGGECREERAGQHRAESAGGRGG